MHTTGTVLWHEMSQRTVPVAHVNEVNGLAMDPQGTDWYFLANGQVQKQYTGLALYDGKWFYIVNGKLASDYTGTVTYDGTEFNVENGMVR